MVKLTAEQFLATLKEAPVWGLTMQPKTGRVLLFYREDHTAPAKRFSSPGIDEMNNLDYRTFLRNLKEVMHTPEIEVRRLF